MTAGMDGAAVPYDQMDFGLETALSKEISPKSGRWPRPGYGLMDLLMVAACCMVFAAVIGVGKPMNPKGPPSALITHDPGATPLRPSAEDHKRLVATASAIFADGFESAVE